MAKEKNQAPEEPRWPDYKETLLARHPGTGEVQAVSDLRERGNRYEVHTVEPLTKNAPSFFEVAKSGAVAAFIRSFKSQSDKAVDFQFLKVPFNAVQDVVNDLLRLTQNPNDEKGLKALYDHRVDTMQLERVKYDHAEIPRAALRELGIDFDALTPQTKEAMRMGLPVEELVPVTAEVMPGIKVSGMFSPRFYRNHNNELKVTLDAPLAVPEYEHEEYKMMFSTQEKAALERGGTLERLIKHKDPLTGEEEWCFVGKNAATNRLVFQPKREVAAAICNDIRRRSAACNATTNCAGASCALSTARRSRSKRWISAASRSCTGIRVRSPDNRLHGFGVHGRSHTEVVRRKVSALPAQISDPAGFRNGQDFRDRTRRFHTSYPEMTRRRTICPPPSCRLSSHGDEIPLEQVEDRRLRIENLTSDGRIGNQSVIAVILQTAGAEVENHTHLFTCQVRLRTNRRPQLGEQSVESFDRLEEVLAQCRKFGGRAQDDAVVHRFSAGMKFACKIRAMSVSRKTILLPSEE